jgi:hypothetical protein
MGQPCLLRRTGVRNVMFLYVIREIEGNGMNQPKNKIFCLFNSQGPSSFQIKKI